MVLLSINDVEYCLLVLPDSLRLWILFHFFRIFQNVNLFLDFFFSLKTYTAPYAVLAELWHRSEMRQAGELIFPVDFRFFIKSMIKKDKFLEEVRSFLVKSLYVEKFLFCQN